MTAARWITALGASALLHGAGLTALAFSTQPDPVPDQPVPKSRFSVEAADVTRSRAAPQDPAGQSLSEATTTPAAVSADPIARSRAMPTALPTDRLASTTAAQRLAPAAAPQALRQSAPSVASLVPPTDTAARLSALNTGTQLKPAAAPRNLAATLAASAPPAPPLNTATEVPATQPPRARLSASATQAPAAPAATPEAPTAASVALPATKGTAALAWSGAQDTSVSAASLAAIAAFSQAGDLAAASAQVRDGIEGILAAVPCARLQTTFLPDTGTLELRGHIPQDALRAPVLDALRAQVGDAIPLSDQLMILPRPQCGALAGIADVGLPQSTEQLTDPAVIGEDGFARSFAYADGDRLSLDLTAPDYAAYVYVDYFAADGTVIHLQPNEIVPLEFAPAKSELSVGRARAGGAPSLELTVSAPYGQEIAAAFAASVPLYEGNRPLVEPAAPYLAFLKERVADARARHADFKGEWVYFFITTAAK